METDNDSSSFWQFSDQLRVQTNNTSATILSLNNDSIWSTPYSSKTPQNRRNFDLTVGAPKSDFNAVNDAWKIGINSAFHNSTITYSKPYLGSDNNYTKTNRVISNGKGDYGHGKKKINNSTNQNQSKDNGNGNGNGVEKRFKTLPPAESLPRNETVGGYVFVCNNDTMQENLKRELFGLPPRYRDSVRQITPGLPLFLYNYSTHQLHGVFESASFGGTNIDPTAWEDKKNLGESRFPAQVRVMTRKLYEPLEEDSFRPILHHYDGPKFRLELGIPEALSLLDIFEESDPTLLALE
jgi:hypothetical protein